MRDKPQVEIREKGGGLRGLAPGECQTQVPPLEDMDRRQVDLATGNPGGPKVSCVTGCLDPDSMYIPAARSAALVTLASHKMQGAGPGAALTLLPLPNLCRPLKTFACVSFRYRKHCGGGGW